MKMKLTEMVAAAYKVVICRDRNDSVVISVDDKIQKRISLSESRKLREEILETGDFSFSYGHAAAGPNAIYFHNEIPQPTVDWDEEEIRKRVVQEQQKAREKSSWGV